MSALTPNDRALRDQINSETRIEQLKIDFDEKLRLLKRQFNIDSDEVRKAVLKRVDDLTATRVTDSENEIIRLDVKTQRVEETIGGQVTKLAANIDQVNEIQRQVLETIDKRVEEIEMTRDNEKTQLQDAVLRLTHAEISLNKLTGLNDTFSGTLERQRLNIELN